ncbi:MAG: hypothetical protein QM790_09015 [Nibricoccus sp.]
MIVQVESKGQKLLYISDLVLHPIGLLHPDWYTKFECRVTDSQATKRRILTRAANEKPLVYAMHFAWPGLGHIEPEGDHWTWKPLSQTGPQ